MTDRDQPAVRPTPEPEAPAPDSRKHVVVGLGASAGGLDALKRFFDTVPRETGLSFVVVVHLSPEHESHLADLLQPHSALPVTQVTGETPIERDQVYVIPPGRNLSTVDSHLRLAPLTEARTDRAPIDHFFRTLAQTHDGASVGVILSGSGSDGANGIRFIRDAGGMTLAQDPEEAQFDGMVRSALETRAVDRVLPVGEMIGEILEFARTQPRVPAVREQEEGGWTGPDDPLHSILTLVRLRTGHDFLRYKRSTVGRRVARRMQILHLERVEAYLELLREDGREAATLLDDLLINVTSFFRDPQVFRALEQQVIPALFEGKERGEAVRVWSVGCATGEEAYSLGMLLLEEASRRTHPPQVQIFATDLHEASLHRGREALFPETIEAEVPPERLERFFRRESGGYRVTKALRDVVVFATHNLLRDPPFSKLDLIVCRNLLIYLQRDVQDEAIEVFHYSLLPGGYLLLGTAETLERAHLFRPADKEAHLYRRHGARRGPSRHPLAPLAAPSRRGGRPEAGAGHAAVQSYGAVHQRMVERYAPPSLLVTADHEVVHTSENAGRFLRYPGGEPTRNLFRLVREEFRMELRTGFHSLRERRAVWRSRPIAVRIEGEERSVVLRMSPAQEPALEGFVLVIFDEVGTAADGAPGAEMVADEHVRGLEEELEGTRARMQALIEEFETSQEEMRASNEELQSANEELRSTLEELETSREELQSVNEELQTVNQENRHKVEELAQLSSDLQNLLQATDVATLFLDRSLRILRYTPRVGEIFNVRHTDRGRPLADLTHRLGYDGLIEDARRVLQTLVPVEREVKGVGSDAWYVLRVSPYRTMEDRIEGVVVTVVDVSRLKHSEEATRRSEAKYRTLFETMHQGFGIAEVLVDQEGRPVDYRMLEINPQFERLTGQSRERFLSGRTVRELAPELEEEWYDFYGTVALTGEPAHREIHAEAWGRWFEVSSYRVGEPEERRVAILYDEITGRKQAEEALRDLNEELERRVEERTREVMEQEERFRILVETAPLMVWTTDARGKVVEDSPSWRAFTGQTMEEWVGDGWTRAVHPDDRAVTIENWFRSVRTVTPVNTEFRVWHAPTATWRWTNVRAVPMRAPDGEVRGWIGMNVDVDARRRAEESRSEALRQLVGAEEEERRRISLELHDSLGQLVTGLILGLGALKSAPDRAAAVADLERLAHRIGREMQGLAVELRPPGLDNLGMERALQGHLEEWSARHGIEATCQFVGVNGARFAPEVENTLYRVVQEGLTNVLKHAHASRVSLVVERRGGVVRAVLEDDGLGFEVEETLASPEKSQRLGLRGMRERVVLLGGEMEIESTPGSGTSVYVRIPDRPAARASTTEPEEG